MKKLFVGFIIITVLGVAAMFAWSIVDPEGYQAYQEQLDAKVESERVEREAEEQAQREAEERRKQEEAEREAARFCKEDYFNHFAVQYNAYEPGPTEPIEKSVISEQTNRVTFHMKNADIVVRRYDYQEADGCSYYKDILSGEYESDKEFLEAIKEYISFTYGWEEKTVETICSTFEKGNDEFRAGKENILVLRFEGGEGKCTRRVTDDWFKER